MGKERSNHAIILAAGRGQRFGGSVPKQFQIVEGRPLIHYSLRTFLNHPDIHSVTVVLPEDYMNFSLPVHGKMRPPVVGGKERHDSTIRALANLSSDGGDGIIIHDAARPLVPHLLIGEVCRALHRADLVTPALPIGDALVDRDNLYVIDRAHYAAIQTPQGFRCYILQEAMARLEQLGQMENLAIPTCEFEIVRVLCPAAKAVLVAGHPQNEKFTHPVDADRMGRSLEKFSTD
ncbi:MAG: 2-C-methyl-D-erythritol 4-phosphate cytidylyltransferase [Puniceicoccales bacterium]|jgi:2-C-methyl-D-erythritol 4-phosphate cytidylyltransferase/2-C-methyl-D-erythritol 2,4-cyclodiphosphate synthase|nr:2-C-methyl-D-erythritol 4-phosphate cytidylyltransferase [Puniceicoccales bacterium]